jgi:membrane protease YdiL (CAAX protease family)
MSANSATKSRRRLATSFAVLVGEPSWVLFSFFFIAALVYGAFTALPPLENLAETTLGQLGVGALVYTLVLGFAILPLIVLRSKQDILRTLGIDKRPTRDVLWLPPLAWTAYMLTTVIVLATVTYFVPWIDAEQVQDIGFDNLTLPYEYVLAFIALVILPPLAEELLFRGYLFGRLRKRFGFLLTTAVVSVIFGLVHLQWNVGIDVAVLSVYLCLLREVTGSVWASIFLHSIKNGVAYFALFIFPLL